MTRRRSQAVHLVALSRAKQRKLEEAIDTLTVLVTNLGEYLVELRERDRRSESARKANRTRKAAQIAVKGGLANGPVEVERPSIPPPPAE